MDDKLLSEGENVGVVAMTAAAYARTMKALLPPGRLWRLAPDSFLSLVFLAAGDELARISGRAVDIVEEADSSTTTELITDFERELQLPNTGTIEERRLRVVALETRRQRFRPIDVQAALAPYLALDAADVDVIETSRALAIATSNDRAIYLFHVYRNPLLGGVPDIAAAQVVLDEISHSHTKGKVIASTSFKCNDPYSLCDRDLLGV